MARIRNLISEQEIAEAVKRLGAQISSDYQGREVTVLGILTGSVILVADLMRQISVPHQLGLIQASSYRGKATTSGELNLNLEFVPDLKGRDVLLVDDIFDTGKTITRTSLELESMGPKSIKTAVLLWKKVRSQVSAVPDYYCFEIPDRFVVGYGLDFDGQYRHLPYLGVVEPESADE